MPAPMRTFRDDMIASCSRCGGQNRVPAARLDARARCGRCKEPLLPLRSPVALHDVSEFDELVRDAPLPVLVDFWAPWCGPCRSVAPEIERLAGTRAGEAIVAKVNTEDLPEVAARYGIRSIPTFIVFRGGKESRRALGARPASDLGTLL
jgi:thioredoxin 2